MIQLIPKKRDAEAKAMYLLFRKWYRKNRKKIDAMMQKAITDMFLTGTAVIDYSSPPASNNKKTSDSPPSHDSSQET